MSRPKVTWAVENVDSGCPEDEFEVYKDALEHAEDQAQTHGQDIAIYRKVAIAHPVRARIEEL